MIWEAFLDAEEGEARLIYQNFYPRPQHTVPGCLGPITFRICRLSRSLATPMFAHVGIRSPNGSSPVNFPISFNPQQETLVLVQLPVHNPGFFYWQQIADLGIFNADFARVEHLHLEYPTDPASAHFDAAFAPFIRLRTLMIGVRGSQRLVRSLLGSPRTPARTPPQPCGCFGSHLGPHH